MCLREPINLDSAHRSKRVFSPYVLGIDPAPKHLGAVLLKGKDVVDYVYLVRTEKTTELRNCEIRKWIVEYGIELHFKVSNMLADNLVDNVAVMIEHPKLFVDHAKTAYVHNMLTGYLFRLCEDFGNVYDVDPTEVKQMSGGGSQADKNYIIRSAETLGFRGLSALQLHPSKPVNYTLQTDLADAFFIALCWRAGLE